MGNKKPQTFPQLTLSPPGEYFVPTGRGSENVHSFSKIRGLLITVEKFDIVK